MSRPRWLLGLYFGKCGQTPSPHSGITINRDTILILDFGSQYTQLIARRIRELSVYSEIVPFNISVDTLLSHRPKGLIFSGGPDSVFRAGAPHSNSALLGLKLPILGICYGVQLFVHQLGGKVVLGEKREYGPAQLQVTGESLLFKNLPRTMPIWMSHGDKVNQLPADFKIVGMSNGIIAAVENSDRKIYGLQFHPEVTHTPYGGDIIKQFLFDICSCTPNWTMQSFINESVKQIQKQVGDGHTLCALSGGVDSTVSALLVQKAIGDKLTCIFVDNGLLRKNEFSQVLQIFKQELSLNVVGIPASERFLKRLVGITDPEMKRKIIGEEFIRVFEEEAAKIGDIKFLVQGTLYPDVIESTSVKGPSAVIKSHHNVGGLPVTMHLKLIEPLRELFKDEVRKLGRELGLGDAFITRHPFPGPGLAVRILGEVTRENLELLRRADEIAIEEIKKAGLYNELWQSFAVLLPIKTVGVMGDERTYENVVAIRAVKSLDGMTADWAKLPYTVLETISSRIVNEVRGVNRVVYDISSKPPSTIEWE